MLFIILFGMAVVAGFLVLIVTPDSPQAGDSTGQTADGSAGGKRAPAGTSPEDSVQPERLPGSAREPVAPSEGWREGVARKGFEILRGMVIDEHGAAVTGAGIRAVRIKTLDHDLPLEVGRICKTTSSHDGRFGFENILPGTYSLVATQGNRVGRSTAFAAGRQNHPDGCSGESVILLKPRGRIDGRVLDPDGTPVPGAVVLPLGLHAAFAETDAGGLFSLQDLEAGVYTLLARTEDLSSKAIEDVVTGRSGLEIRLAPTGGIRGRVMLDGRPAPAVTVKAIGIAAFERGTFEAATNDAGRYTLKGLAAGRYRIVAAAKDLAAPTISPVTVGEGELLEDVDFELERTGALAGRVSDMATGEPLAGIWVEAIYAKDAIGYFRVPGEDRTYFQEFDRTHALTDKEGRFLLTSLAPTAYILAARGASSHAPALWEAGKILELVPGGRKDGLEIRLRKGQTLAVTVRGESGEALTGARVTLVDVQFQDRESPAYREVDLLPPAEEMGEGEYLFKGLGPGRLRLSVERVGWVRATKTVIIAEGADPTNLEMVLSPSFVLAGRVTNPGGRGIAGAGVKIHGDRQGVTDENGSFRVLDVSPERTSVQAFAEGYMTLNKWMPLERGMESLELTLKPLGSHFLAGLVKNDLGEPVSGVNIVVNQSDGEYRLSRSGTSDEAGRFYIDGLEKMRTTLYFSTNQGSPRNPHQNAEVDAGDMELVVDRFAKIKGRVVDPEGVPVPYSTVSIEAGYAAVGARPRVSRSGHDGGFCLDEVPPGKVTLRVTTPEGMEGASDPIEIEPAETREGVTIALRRMCALSGRVLEQATSKPVSDAVVTVEKEEKKGRPAYYLPRSRKASAATKEDGSFVMKNLKPGRVIVRAAHPEYLEAVQREVELVEGETTGSLDILLERGGSIEGHVYVDGLPTAGVQVNSDDESYNRKQAISDQEGFFRIDHLGPGKYTLTASTAAYDAEQRSGRNIRKIVHLGRGERLYCALTFVPGGSIAGTAYLFRKPKGEISIRAYPRFRGEDENDPRQYGWARSGEDGTYRIDGLLPGRYSVSASCREEDQNYNFDQEIDIGPGVTRLDLHIGATGTGEISGTVYRNGVPASSVSVGCSGEGVRQNQYTDEKGSFKFTELPAGRIYLSAYLWHWTSGTSFHKSETLNLEDGASIRHDFHFQLGSGVIFGAITCNGEPVDRGFLSLSRQADKPEDGFSISIQGREGGYRVEMLPPGRYALGLHQPFRMSRVVEVDDNEVRVDFEFAKGDAVLSGTVTRPSDSKEFGYTMIYLFKPGACPFQAGKPSGRPDFLEGLVTYTSIGQGGAFRIEDLPPDTFDVAAVRIKGGMVLKLDVRRVTLQEGAPLKVSLDVGE